MKKIIVKFFIPFTLIGILLGFTGWLVARQILITQATQKAHAIIEQALKENPEATHDEKIVAITTEIFKEFGHQDPARIPLYSFRPYLTNHRLPEWFRLPDGVMETQLKKGYCDNAARMLSFALKQEGFDSVQWNMVSPSTAHSALLVTTPENRKIFADPFYGYVTVDSDKKLIDPNHAQRIFNSGKKFEDIFVSLGEGSDPRFYQKFQNVSMSAQGEPLTLTATLPFLNSKSLTLGEINSDDLDVKSAGMQLGLNPFWHYIGHKYNREWVRVLEVQEPIIITMTLVDLSEDGILNATPIPAINGKVITWKLNAGEKITLKDGSAKLSLRRLNSYIGVDQIVFSPVR